MLQESFELSDRQKEGFSTEPLLPSLVSISVISNMQTENISAHMKGFFDPAWTDKPACGAVRQTECHPKGPSVIIH